jgi:hypothetical protein
VFCAVAVAVTALLQSMISFLSVDSSRRYLGVSLTTFDPQQNRAHKSTQGGGGVRKGPGGGREVTAQGHDERCGFGLEDYVRPQSGQCPSGRVMFGCAEIPSLATFTKPLMFHNFFHFLKV